MKHATKIEWTQRVNTKGETLNPIRARNKETGGIGHFCQHVSPGCLNCFAERLQPRFRNPIKYRPQDRDKVEIFLDEKVLTKPLRWRAPRTIFWCSMTDYAAPWVEYRWIDKILAVCARTPQHTHQLLSKYPERVLQHLVGCERRIAELVAESESRYGWQTRHDETGAAVGFDQPCWPLPNVWLMTSCEDQRRLDERWPHLRDTPAAVRGISYEPALTVIDFSGHDMTGLDWVIYGGESAGTRLEEPRQQNWDWARFTRDQCAERGIAFFLKQGNKGPGWKDPIPEDLQIHEWPEAGA